jgi:hypothetical protein
MDRRCAHQGADLAAGSVRGETIGCPLHAWEYGSDGRCVRIPAQSDIPAFARQMTYPAEERGGLVFFFNRPTPLFALPWFDGMPPDQLRRAAPFEFEVEIPWYMVGANGFDAQHFRAAHDRTLDGPHTVDCPAPHARRITATFAVTGTSIRDRLTRAFSGPKVTLSVTVWAGTLIFVSATFRRTTSYGMVSVDPIGPTRSRMRTVVFVPRSRNVVGRALFDPLDARVRRSFIREFVKSDADRSEGIRYNPATLIDADRELASYMSWLHELVSTSSPTSTGRISP